MRRFENESHLGLSFNDNVHIQINHLCNPQTTYKEIYNMLKTKIALEKKTLDTSSSEHFIALYLQKKEKERKFY